MSAHQPYERLDLTSPLAAVDAVTAPVSLFAGLEPEARAAVAREVEWVSLEGESLQEIAEVGYRTAPPLVSAWVSERASIGR